MSKKLVETVKARLSKQGINGAQVKQYFQDVSLFAKDYQGYMLNEDNGKRISNKTGKMVPLSLKARSIDYADDLAIRIASKLHITLIPIVRGASGTRNSTVISVIDA